MEIKKYVLLKNKIIIDISKLKSDWSSEKDYTIKNNFLYQHTSKKIKPFVLTGHGEGGVIDFMPTEKKLGQIIKSSDNILDLVEVRDLIQCEYHKEDSNGLKWIETPVYYVNGISDTHFHLPVFSIEKNDKHIKAIYKKQPNGDYKKYEVKE